MLTNAELVTAILLLLTHGTAGIDPCKEAKTIQFDSIRLYAYNQPPGEDYLCDRNVIDETKWYRATEDIVTNKTVPNACGTKLPIWMNGIIPTTADTIGKEVNRTACVPGIHSPCDTEYPIKVINCGNYRVYQLKKPDGCPKAYCFGYGVKDTPPTQKTLKPTLEHIFTKEPDFITHQLNNFKCVFPFLTSSVHSLYYQIYWYINDVNAYVSDAVKEEDFAQTYLNEHNGILKMGIRISCSVRLKHHPRGLPGPMSDKSHSFFAGVKISRNSVLIKRGESEEVEFTLTVPFPCAYNGDAVDKKCSLQINMEVPQGTSGTCESRLVSKSQCGVAIKPRDTWNETHILNIVHKDTGNYILTPSESERKVYLRIDKFPYGSAWAGLELPVINVHIVDKDDAWKGSSCTAHSDPHMTTFDQFPYDNQNSGTFTMYRYNDSNGNIMEVQTKVTPCNNSTSIFCICGLAVRSAGDVVVINRCPGLKRKIFEFRSCVDNTLEVRKIDDLNYKIHMPTGTYVQTRLRIFTGVYVMEVDIFPSSVDKNKSEGLCSRLGSRKLIKRDGTVEPNSHDPNQFSLSWRVRDEDNLLEMSDENVTQLPSLRSSYIVCTCASNTSSISILNEATCSDEKRITCDIFKSQPLQKNTCYAKRRKRSLHAQLSYIPNNFIYHHHRQKRSVTYNSKVVMNKDQARSFCLKYMNDSAGYKACQDVPNVNPDHALRDCIADILLTNSTSWAIAAREGLKTLCFKELSQNNTLQNTTESSGVSIVESILSVACPSECSNEGTCDNGTCICNTGYGAADCSINLDDPPIVNGVNLDHGGLCDKQHCSKAIVEGDMFLDMPTLTCKMHRFEIPYEGNITYRETTDIKANHNSISDVICPFPNARRRRSADTSFISGYKISMSNNGKNFSPSHMMYILDSTCQDTMDISGELRFSLKDGFCFINGHCITDGTQDGSNICHICNYKSNVFSWTVHSTNPECEKEKSSNLWIIGVVMGCVAILVFLGILLIYVKKKNRIIGTVPPPYEK